MSNVLDRYYAVTEPGFPENTHIAAFDIGSKCGVCFANSSTIRTECVELVTGREMRQFVKDDGDTQAYDPRFPVLFKILSDWLEQVRTSSSSYNRRIIVAWEAVQFVHSTQQIMLWTTLRAALWGAVAAGSMDVEMFGVPVGTLKKFAGRGNLNKEGMLAAAVERGIFTKGMPVDDNLVDARWIAEFVIQTVKKGNA